MKLSASRRAGADPTEDTLRGCIARDLLLLADLHDHEPDRAAVVALWARCYDGLLEAKPYGRAVRDAVNRFSDSLTEIPTCFDADAGAALLADFRRVCATDGESSRGSESAGDWDTDAHGIEAKALHHWPAPRGPAAASGLGGDGSDLAAKLRYLAYLVAADGVAAPAQTLKQHLDEHVLSRVEGFVADVVGHSGTHFFQELGVLTVAYLHELGQRCANGELDGRRPPDRPPQSVTASALARQAGLERSDPTAGIRSDEHWGA